MDQILKYQYHNGVKTIYPTHPKVSNLRFEDGEQYEAILVNTIAHIAEKNGVDMDSLFYLNSAILRILKSKSAWANN